MSAYVYLWDIFACVCVCALFMEYYLRLLAKINQESVKNIYNWDYIFFLFVFGGWKRMRLQIHRPTRWPQPDQSVWLLVRFVGGSWKHGSHSTYTVPTLHFVIFSAGFLFRLYSWVCNHVVWKHFIRFMGKFLLFYIIC